MKNVIKIGFLALSFGLFAVACGGAKTETTGDSTATAASNTIDSAATAATANVDSVANAAKATVDSAAKTVDSAAAHH
ncbi:hypothetical protein [Chitinophaga arvensicola]|jgi:hypothetical protein|uniref:Lipoprotein n=1 Tax=Chitinophaga arvensicola TaxID=29529 RepID=A0A1I0SED3_9BACT|nr:hypothetical protein [Chitinophaga arvensicola]SEW54717.1 hypothetical protein SAMN04488122_6141 [Chitinophaga arvensicola]